jgi:hypothetical protein
MQISQARRNTWNKIRISTPSTPCARACPWWIAERCPIVFLEDHVAGASRLLQFSEMSAGVVLLVPPPLAPPPPPPACVYRLRCRKGDLDLCRSSSVWRFGPLNVVLLVRSVRSLLVVLVVLLVVLRVVLLVVRGCSCVARRLVLSSFLKVCW